MLHCCPYSLLYCHLNVLIMKNVIKRKKRRSKKKFGANDSLGSVNNNIDAEFSVSDFTTEMMCQMYEGQLYKYTNVMKGWQFRWFLLDPKTGVLNYYLNEGERKHQPRGWVHLEAAVISPSDEDSNTFTVNSTSGESFKLRAHDAKARQEWVNRLRAVSQHLASSQSSTSVLGRELSQPSSIPISSNCPMALCDAFTSVRNYLDKAEQSSFLLTRAIDDLPSSGSVRHIDNDMLLLKATAQSTLVCLSQCYCILQQQTYDNQSVRVTKNLSKHDHPTSHSSKKKYPRLVAASLIKN